MRRCHVVFAIVLIVACIPSVSAEGTYEYGVDYWFTSETTLHTAEGWDITFEIVQEYEIEGIVLDTKIYREQSLVFSPIDIALVWGDLSDKLSSFTSTMGERRLEYSWLSFDRSISKEYVTTHVSNNHCIPAYEEVYDALLTIAQGDEVSIKGYLVNVTGVLVDGSTIRTLEWGPSSTSFEDSGPGSCEIILISSLIVNGIEYPVKIVEPVINDAGIGEVEEVKTYLSIVSYASREDISDFSYTWIKDETSINLEFFYGHLGTVEESSSLFAIATVLIGSLLIMVTYGTYRFTRKK